MVSHTNGQQETERKRLRLIQVCYLTFWIILWVLQRTMEYLTIDYKYNNQNAQVGKPLRYSLLIFNILELLMELCLYGFLVKVSFILAQFLKSFSEQAQGGILYQGAAAQSTESQDTINKGKTIFKIIMVNIICMMIFDSVFSALSPYLWLGDVFVKNDTFVIVYMFSTSMFYIANTFFACLMIYVMHHFGQHVEALTGDSKKLRDTDRQSDVEKSRNTYLDLNDEDGMNSNQQ